MDFWLVSADGVRLHARHRPARPNVGAGGVAAGGVAAGALAVVLVSGFAGSGRQERVARVADLLTGFAGVVTVDLRGHGRSGGRTTLGLAEPADVRAAVEWARARYTRVAVLGFSMGAAVALRAAALYGGVDAVAAVSGPAFWYYRGTVVMRRLHWAVMSPLGRAAIRLRMRTRVSPVPWPEPPPLSPVEAAEAIPPTPLLIVHGDRDPFFPLDHPHALDESARRGVAESGGRVDLWIERGFGHAEGALDADLVRRIGQWIVEACAAGGTPSRSGELETT